MRIAIYGAGSLGTILGAYISKAGVNIDLINRNKAHIEALQAKGAQVTGTVQFTQPVKAYTPDQMNGKYDILFLMTKQQHNAEVVTMLKDYLADDGVLVTFQNGLPEVQIAEILGEERVLVSLSNKSAEAGRKISADGVKIGGGYGNIARSVSSHLQQEDIEYEAMTSEYPRFCEGSRSF